MPMTIQDLKIFFENQFKAYLKTFSDLSDGLVADNRKAYCFDDIKNHYPNKALIASADAMMMTRDRVYLIEFKSGFHRNEDLENNKSKIESQRRSIRLKACESYIFLEKVICDGNKLNFKKTYMAVIDAKDDYKGTLSEFYINHGIEGSAYSEKAKLLKDMTEKSLIHYRKMIGGKWIMYDEIIVVYDYEFVEAIGECK